MMPIEQIKVRPLARSPIHRIVVRAHIFHQDTMRCFNPLRLATVVARHALGELRRHGLGGVFRRLPYYYARRSLIADLLRQKLAVSPKLWSFQSQPPVTRPLRLHPDLTDEISPIDARISIVIPTLNPGAEFSMLLRKLKEQCGVTAVEVVIVDSGSTDGATEVARNFGCTVVEIPPEQFTHSGARNLGAEHARSDYLLFMVQDAYPIGKHWLYGMLRYLLDHAEQGLVAVSCAETPRSDSDMLYDSMIDTHYRFLGCRDQDRLGILQGNDHMALRTQGQLSDVACLIRHADFQRYRYSGDYAEDLDLGIRIIRDGMSVAMLASVKVVHSHNRPAIYYLKRSFVDVVFLVGMFDDFPQPQVQSLGELLNAIDHVARELSSWLQNGQGLDENKSLGEIVQRWIRHWRATLLSKQQTTQNVALGDSRFDDAINRLGQGRGLIDNQHSVADAQDMQQFIDMFLGRVEHFARFAAPIYPVLDKRTAAELRNVVTKIFAATAGAALGFAYVQFREGPRELADTVQTIFAELKTGV